MAKKQETNIQNSALVEISQAGNLAWRHNVGLFRAYDNPDRVITIGTPGQSDVFLGVPVVITPDMVGKTVGVLVSMEMKTATGKQRREQKRWQLAVEKIGAIYLVTRSIEQALQQIASIPAIICGRSGMDE